MIQLQLLRFALLIIAAATYFGIVVMTKLASFYINHYVW